MNFPVGCKVLSALRIPSSLSCWRCYSTMEKTKYPVIFTLNEKQYPYYRKTGQYVPTVVLRRNLTRESFAPYLSVDFAPINLAYKTLEYVHETTGLPWWGAIALTTFGLRSIVTLPLSIYSQRILSKIENLQPEIGKLAMELKGEVASAMKQFGWNNKIARYHYNKNLKRLVRELQVRDNCHPFKASLVVWIQLPMWISISLALRNMAGFLPILGQQCKVVSPSLESEGALWFTNMLVPDSTLLLPVLVALFNLANVELHALRVQKPSTFSRGLTNFMRVISLLMIPIGASVPSCMCFYWACSSFFGFGQNILLRIPSIRRVLPIPPTPNQSKTPFQDIVMAAKNKYGRDKKNSVK